MEKCLDKVPRMSSSFKSLIFRRVHILQWLPKYTKSDIIADFIAGLTVGLTMMPQAIAYANLAGLPAQYGLYTAFIGSFTYIIFGTVKEVSIGPTSLMALLTFSATEDLPVDYVILLTLLTGCVEFSMGLFNLGFLIDFISPCVTSGFTSAMSLTIITSQLKNIFGLTKLKNHGIFDVLYQVFSRLSDIRLADTLLSVSCFIFLFIFKKFMSIKVKNKFLKKTLWILSISKNALVVLITSVIAFYFYEYGGGSPFILSGTVPSGLPQLHLPPFSTKIGNETVTFIEMIQTLGSSIIVVPMAAVLANVAIAKAFASDKVVDATQEMMTLGLCNIFGSFLQAMPSCGAFTRSAVASSSAVRTPLQGIYSGTVILLALSFLTPYFYYIPRATLGMVLIAAIATMIDYEIFPKLWKSNKFDFFITAATFLIGIFYGVEIGIIAGSLLNLLVLLKIWTRPRIISEIRADDKANEYIYIKLEIGLYYSASDYLTSTIAQAHSTAINLPIVLDCANIIRIDYAACETINNLAKTYNKMCQKFTLINVNPKILKILKAAIPVDDLQIYRSTDDVHSNKTQNSDTPLLNKDFPESRLSFYDNV